MKSSKRKKVNGLVDEAKAIDVEVTTNNQGHYSKAVETLRQLDNALGKGNLTDALEYFAEDASIEVINPTYLTSRELDL